MSVLGIAVIASLLFLIWKRTWIDGERIRLFSKASVPVAFLAFVITTALLWQFFCPDNPADLSRLVALGVIQTVFGLLVIAYMVVALRRQQ